MVIVGFAIAVYFDAQKRGVKHQGTGKFLDLGPVGWAVATGLLWIISFPLYLVSRSKTPDESGLPTQGKNNAVGWIIYFVVLALIGLSQFSGSPQERSINDQLAPVAETPDRAQAETSTPAKAPAMRIDFANLQDAIASTLPHMADTSNGEISKGGAFLALWSDRNLKWSELQEVPAGKFALVMKDSETQRGKRICTSGTVIEISVDATVPGKKIYIGGMYDDSGSLYRFVAVRSTGEIVAQSRAKFCGIITGQQHYPNSVGGVAHSVHLVGMFDLPENK